MHLREEHHDPHRAPLLRLHQGLLRRAGRVLAPPARRERDSEAAGGHGGMGGDVLPKGIVQGRGGRVVLHPAVLRAAGVGRRAAGPRGHQDPEAAAGVAEDRELRRRVKEKPREGAARDATTRGAGRGIRRPTPFWHAVRGAGRRTAVMEADRLVACGTPPHPELWEPAAPPGGPRPLPIPPSGSFIPLALYCWPRHWPKACTTAAIRNPHRSARSASRRRRTRGPRKCIRTAQSAARLPNRRSGPLIDAPVMPGWVGGAGRRCR